MACIKTEISKVLFNHSVRELCILEYLNTSHNMTYITNVVESTCLVLYAHAYKFMISIKTKCLKLPQYVHVLVNASMFEMIARVMALKKYDF